MTATVLACVEWRALDREGTDRCRLSRAAHGWLLVGHARFWDDLGFAALDYVVRCDTGWATLSADIAGEHDGREVQVRIQRSGARWWVNDLEQEAVSGAVDIDLSFTPATNLMPLRRLMDRRDIMLDTNAAWLRYPMAALTPLDQTYSRTERPGCVRYTAQQTRYETELMVDSSGFVTLYPELWAGEVSDAD